MTDRILYQIHTEPVFTGAEQVTESRWHQPWSDPTRRKGINVALISASGLYYTPGQVTEFIFEDKWHFPWSEPIVKNKVGLRAASQQFIAFHPNPIINIGWFGNLSDPVRIKPGLKAAEQSVLAYNPQPQVSFSWFEWLSDPKRFKRGQPAQEQPYFQYQPTPIISIPWFEWLSEPVRKKRGQPPTVQPFFEFFPNPTVSFGWFASLSEPKRFKPRLLEGDQKPDFLSAFIPTQYTMRLDATETRDVFLGVLRQNNIVVSAYVDIRELSPGRGYVGLIEDDNVTASIAVAEPVAVGVGGTPIIPVASARVGIREL